MSSKDYLVNFDSLLISGQPNGERTGLKKYADFYYAERGGDLNSWNFKDYKNYGLFPFSEVPSHQFL